MSDASRSVKVPVPTHYYQFDQQGIAFNMWYLAFMEQARNGFLAARGFSLEDLLSSSHDIQLVHAEISWNAALRYGESLDIDVELAHAGTTSFSLRHVLEVRGDTRARASVVYVIVDNATHQKAVLPDGLRRALVGEPS